MEFLLSHTVVFAYGQESFFGQVDKVYRYTREQMQNDARRKFGLLGLTFRVYAPISPVLLALPKPGVDWLEVTSVSAEATGALSQLRLNKWSSQSTL